MSITLMSQTWQKQLSGNVQLVALCLADHADDDGVCWPTLPVIAWKVGCNERTVRRAIETLEGMGAVTKRRRFQKSAMYYLDFSVIPDKPDRPIVDKLSGLADFEKPRVDKSSPRVDTALSAKSGHSSVHLITKEPSQEPPERESPIIPKADKSDKSDIPVRRQQFLDLWKAYPVGRKADREVCYREFLRAIEDDDDVELMMFALDGFKNTDQWQQENGRFIPYLKRFINERRWDGFDPSMLQPSTQKNGHTRLLEIALGGGDD